MGSFEENCPKSALRILLNPLLHFDIIKNSKRNRIGIICLYDMRREGVSEIAERNTTKNVLAAALKEVMAEKPLEKIGIGEICERCGMNRKSSYYHFKDKYDLVNWISVLILWQTVLPARLLDGCMKRIRCRRSNLWTPLLS